MCDSVVLPLIYSSLRTNLGPLLLLIFFHVIGQGCWGGKCSDSVVVLRGPHGVIQTPNFPNKFDTPISCKWIIDSTEVDLMLAPNQRKSINVYFTQMNLKDNLKFVEYDNYSSEWQGESVVHWPNLKTTKIWQTTNRYLGIEFSLSTPYQSHLRTRDYFLDEYGFNITYEIVPEHVQRNDTCSFSTCSFAGKCYVTHDFQKFYCDCLRDHFGTFCWNNHKNCDPQRNISFCARGTCRNYGSWSSVCYCPEGYSGPKCENPIRPVIKECPGPYCDEVCPSSEPPKRPCGCHYGRMVPQGWVRYEGKLKLAGTPLSQWDFRNVSKPSDSRELKILNRIEEVLTGKLQTTNASVSNVSIISVGPASEFIFRFFGNQSAYNASFNALAHLKSAGKIDEDLWLGGAFNFDIQPSLSLKGVTLSATKIIRTMDDFSITCEAVGSENLKFLWFKDDIPINRSLATRYIYEDHIPKNNNDRSRSVLILYQVSIYDRGTFTCQASDMGEMQCASVFVDVLLAPIIEVEPLSLTLVRNDSAIITCFANNDSGNHSCEYTWYRDSVRIEKGKVGGKVVVEDLDYPRGSLLRILQADSSATYSCVAANYAGTSQRDVRVEVLDSAHSPSCRGVAEASSNVVWRWTAVNQTSMAKCPSGYTGFAQRTCQMQGLKPQWSKSDFSRCMSSPLKTINNTLQKVRMGFAVHNSAENLLELFATYLEKKKFLYSGEGDTIIHVLNDAANYAQEKKRVRESFTIFLTSVTRLLEFPESFVHQRSVVTLITLLQSMGKDYSTTIAASEAYKYTSDLLVIEVVPMDVLNQARNLSHEFPGKNSEYPDWLNLRLQVPVNLERVGTERRGGLIFTVFRNLTDTLPSSQKVFLVRQGKPAEVVSPIVVMANPEGYSIREDSHIYMEFDIPPQLLRKLSTGKINLTCGAVETKNDVIRWTMNACIFKGMVNSTASCQCDTFGQYALLSVRIGENDKGSYVPNFHWSVLVGTIVCIIGSAFALLCISVHLEFKLRSNNLYFLKMILCLSLISSLLLILSVPIDTTSVAKCTALCTLLIVSLCCQLTKSLYVLLATQLELFPWLRSVSLMTLLGAVSFGCVLPVWTAAAAVSHSQATDPERRNFPVLGEGSPVFSTFTATVSLVVLGFLLLYYRAVLHLRSARNGTDPEKNYITDYRLNTLHRALVVTMSLLVTILAMILYGNITDGVIYQYFFGSSLVGLGILVAMTYTVKSEYPIPVSVVKFLYPTRDIPVDPENIGGLDATGSGKGLVHSNRSPEKRFENGGVSTSLLEVQASSANNTGEGVGSGGTLDTCMGSSLSTSLVTGVSRQESMKRTCSSQTVEHRGSFSSTSNKIPKSLTNPVVSVGGSSSKNVVPKVSTSSTGFPPQQGCFKKNRSNRSNSASVSSSVGKNNSGMCEGFRPLRGRCLLSEVSQADYVMPSISSRLASEKTTGTGGLSSQSGLYSGTYVDPSCQYGASSTTSAAAAVVDQVNERDISQFLTFIHQDYIEAEAPSSDGKGYPDSNLSSSSSSCPYNNNSSSNNITDPGTSLNGSQRADQPENNVKVHFRDESSSSSVHETHHHNRRSHPPLLPSADGSSSSSSFVSFRKGDVVVLAEPGREMNGERNNAYLHSAPLQVDNSSSKSLSTGSEDDGNTTSFPSITPTATTAVVVGFTNHSSNYHKDRVRGEPLLDDSQQLKAENLVKKISHDLDIILDRPKVGGRKVSDVQL